MIGRLSGRLVSLRPGRILLDVGGVGYEVAVSLQSYAELERLSNRQQVELSIHTHVREDQIALFGFASEGERELFELLLQVSGIGPRLALTILSGLPFGELAEALRKGDLERLVTIPGIGRKTAERLVVELRDRVAGGLVAGGAEAGSKGSVEKDLVDALVHLGYKPALAERVAAEARRERPAAEFGELLRLALSRLSRG